MNLIQNPSQVSPSPKQTFVLASCKPWHQPALAELTLKNEGNWIYVSDKRELEQVVSTNQPRYIFFLHWNWLVPRSIWQSYECVCFHMTDVPYGRGGSPLQNLVLAGHTRTVLSALQMIDELDAGPVYAKMPLELDGSAEQIYVKAGELSMQIIQWMIRTNPIANPQTGKVVVFKRRRPEQSVIPKSGNLQSTFDFIRMLDADGYPRAFIDHGKFVINFRDAKLREGRVSAEAEILINNNHQEVQK
jgi:methionyl-tRNA formyltransferase